MLGVYQRTKNEAGKWRYIKESEGRGVRTKLLPPFYTRPTINGRQSWHPLHAQSFDSAKEEASHLETGLAAQAKGMTVAELDATTNAHRVPIASAVEHYLELKKNKARKTIQQYRLALDEFVEIMHERKVRFLDAVTVDALRYYANEMTKRAKAISAYGAKCLAPRTPFASISIFIVSARPARRVGTRTAYLCAPSSIGWDTSR